MILSHILIVEVDKNQRFGRIAAGGRMQCIAYTVKLKEYTDIDKSMLIN